MSIVYSDQIIFILAPIYAIIPEFCIAVYTQFVHDDFWLKPIALSVECDESINIVIERNDGSNLIDHNENAIYDSFFNRDFKVNSDNPNHSFELQLSLSQVMILILIR